MIVGFVTTGHMNVLVRVAGPALSEFGISDCMPQPAFTLLNGFSPVSLPGGFVQTATGLVTATDWNSSSILGLYAGIAAIQVGAFPFRIGSLDSAVTFDVGDGHWSVWALTASASPAGSGKRELVEVYEVASLPH